jgi:hypothetical protein
METMQRKLIDLPLPVVRAIGRRAKAKSMPFKKYVETLIEEDARKDDIEASIPDEITDPALRSLVGIARRKDTFETNGDDRLDYILSKL